MKRYLIWSFHQDLGCVKRTILHAARAVRDGEGERGGGEEGREGGEGDARPPDLTHCYRS